MAAPRIVPLLAIIFPERIFYYSTIDLHVLNFSLAPFVGLPSDEHVGTVFTAHMLSAPNVSRDFDVFNPGISETNVKVTLDNLERLQDYGHLYPLESCVCVFVQYDYINGVEILRVTGKMSDVSFDIGKFEFTVAPLSKAYFIKQPVRILEEDTFQNIHIFGPFEENPLSVFGILIDIAPADVTDDPPAMLVPGGTWPINIGDDNEVRNIVAFVEHASLYNIDDDDYWVGALISIIEDPLGVGQFIERTYKDPATNIPIPDSPYWDAVSGTGWPNSYDPAGIGTPYAFPCRPLISKFALGDAGYIIKNIAGKNAQFDAVNKRGRVWLDVRGPELVDWTDAADGTRRIPSKYRVWPADQVPHRQWYEKRTESSIAMANLSQRHVLQIIRRSIPEGKEAGGQPFPIAYGFIRRGKMIHAIGGKAIGDQEGAGSDFYIACGHRMAFRVVVNREHAAASANNWLTERIQFQEAQIWHSLDILSKASERESKPYQRNINEFGPHSLNPFPRASRHVRVWSDGGPGVGSHYTYGVEFDPYVMWFNADEDLGHRYPQGFPAENRQITLIDNKGNDQYSGFRLRGDEYWADIAEENLGPVGPPDAALDNPLQPQFPVRNGLGGSSVFLDFCGHPDFDDGFITGLPQTSVRAGRGETGNITNPAGMLINPADIVAHYLLAYTELNGDRSMIDWPSFRRTRGELFGWRLSMFLNTVQSGEDILSNISRQTRCNIDFINGRWYMRYINLDPLRHISYVLNDDTILTKNFTIKRLGAGSLYSKFTVNYAKNRPQETWDDSIELTPETNRDCAVAKQLYGATESFTIDCDIIDEWSIANQLAHYLVKLYTKPRLEVNLQTVLDVSTRTLEPGDIVIIQSKGLPNRARFERPGIDFDIAPRQPFVITKISANNNVVDATFLQLHQASG